MVVRPFVNPLIRGVGGGGILMLSSVTQILLILCVLCMCARGVLSPLVLIFVAVSVSLVRTFRVPTKMTIVRRMLPGRRCSGNMDIGISYAGVTMLIKANLSNVIVDSFKVNVSLTVSTLVFLVSTLLVMGVRFSIRRRGGAGQVVNERCLVSLESKFDCMFSRGGLLGLYFLYVLVGSTIIPFSTLLTPVTERVFDKSTGVISLLDMDMAVNAVLKSLAFTGVGRRGGGGALIAFYKVILNMCCIFVTFISGCVTGPVARGLLLLVNSVVVNTTLKLVVACMRIGFMGRIAGRCVKHISTVQFSLACTYTPIMSFIVDVVCGIAIISADSLFIKFNVMVVVLFLLTGGVAFSPLGGNSGDC